MVGAPGAAAGAIPPVPFSGTLTILPLESVTRRFALLLPVLVGTNCTPISHPPSGFTGVRQVLLGPSLYCAALAPVRSIAEIVSGPLPELPITALSSREVDPTPVVGNTIPAGGTGSATNMTPRLEPLSATVRVATAVSSATVRVAAEVLPASGVKVTSIVQRVPTSTVAGATGQLFVTSKAAALAPATPTELIVIGASPVLA